MGIRVGLDIGVASVGWAVVDDEYNVLEAGSNLFECADASKNAERRDFRQGRRGKRRERTRKNDFNKLWTSYKLEAPETLSNHSLELRVKGISNQLTQDELYTVLLNMLKHRGISYLEDAIDESTSNSSDYVKGIQFNQQQLKKQYPCEIQLSRLEQYGQYRGNMKITDENEETLVLSNVFTIAAYREELEKLFDTQQQYFPFLTDNFIKQYMEIFDRKRAYYEGAGNELSRTDYGRFTTTIDPKTGEYITEENIFEKLIGKCSVYPEEMRAAGATFTAQEFNVLNDLNNLTINNRKLTQNEKELLVEEIKNANIVNVKKLIQKVIDEEITTFAGARIDKSGKEIFHSFEIYRKMRKSLEDININILDLTREELDKIGNILTLNTEKDAIIKAFKQQGIQNNDKLAEWAVSFRKKNSSLFNKWQSFSLKIMEELIPELYEQPKNQMQLLTDMGVFRPKTELFQQYKYVPRELVLEDMYNPVVRRSVQVAIEIVNALIKKYNNIEQIVIEMPRDRNSEEEKKKIQDIQKNNEKELSEIIAKIKEEYGIVITDNDFRNHKKLALKLKLWNEQEEICLYSGKPIRIEDLLNNPNLFEIDHAIPISISLDDSRTNKVLVYGTENQDKGARTPYMYLCDVNREWDFHMYMNQVLTLKDKKKITSTKANKLLFMEDITKIDVIKGFINRNLNDTRYASRVILNTLQEYFKGKGTETKVRVVRGSFTHQMRVNLQLEKNREESYSHHAVDAMLLCFSQMGYESYRKIQEQCIDFEGEGTVDKTRWEECMGEKAYWDALYQEKWMRIRTNIKQAEKKVKYWHKVDRKCNRSLCNQTIRGTRSMDNKIYKINKLDLYTDDGVGKFKKLISGKKENQILMYHNDPKTFEQIMLIYEEYKDAKNPFVQYQKETGDYVRKYAKNHNGPKVTKLKYMDGVVESCIDISHKYGQEKGSKKVILESLKPYRMDVYYKASEQKYYFVGVKYSDICCKQNHYEINDESYNEILIKEKMIQPGQSRYDLEKLGFEFYFSFYKNDYIEYEKNGEIFCERFLSRTKPQSFNYIETKPIDAAKFEKQNLVGLSKTTLVRKINVDILGNRFYCKKEKFKQIVDKK